MRWPLWRFCEVILAQQQEALFDFQRLREELLTNVHGDLPILAIRLQFLDIWQAHTYAHMVDHWVEVAPDHVTTKIIKDMGDLGIEPRSQYLQASASTNGASAFLC